MIKLEMVPSGLSELIDAYGNPDADADWMLDPHWFVANIRRFELPFSMRLSWDKQRRIRYFQAHYLVGGVIVDAMAEVCSHPEFTEDLHDSWGGCFNFRPMRGRASMSTHSWGIAVDICPELGPLGGDPRKYPNFIVEAFLKRHMVWGGEWKRADPMHFQAVVNY